MRIIKAGSIPAKFKPHQGQCTECKTIFDFMESEARLADAHPINSRVPCGKYWVCACPVCKSEIVVQADVKNAWDTDMTDQQIVDRENR